MNCHQVILESCVEMRTVVAMRQVRGGGGGGDKACNLEAVVWFTISKLMLNLHSTIR